MESRFNKLLHNTPGVLLFFRLDVANADFLGAFWLIWSFKVATVFFLQNLVVELTAIFCRFIQCLWYHFNERKFVTEKKAKNSFKESFSPYLYFFFLYYFYP